MATISALFRVFIFPMFASLHWMAGNFSTPSSPKQTPLRLSFLQRQKEFPLLQSKAFSYFGNERFSYIFKFFIAHGN
ncbi:MAG: hypothetical protein DMG69_01060 [Acidobacteria bacterium]|nr:MAG: hypothetical protein DMG69_01060 [Acidobacteriota bacterium]